MRILNALQGPSTLHSSHFVGTDTNANSISGSLPHAVWERLLPAGVQVPAHVDMSLRQQLEDMGFDANK